MWLLAKALRQNFEILYKEWVEYEHNYKGREPNPTTKGEWTFAEQNPVCGVLYSRRG